MMAAPTNRVSGIPAEADVLDLIDAAGFLERQLDLDDGSIIRELTGLLNRRRRFERLRRDYDVRHN